MPHLNWVVLTVVAAAIGCTSTAAPEQETCPCWSDEEPVVLPTERVERDVGRLVVRTPRAPDRMGKGPSPLAWRGYRLYDDKGEIVHRCQTHLTVTSDLDLRPGRYILVGRFGDQAEGERRIQLIVAKSQATYVDVMNPSVTKPSEPPR